MRAISDAERAAYTRWQRRRRRLIGYGQWEPFVDSEPVRAHVRALQGEGMATRAIEKAAGLPESGLKPLMWGSSGRPPTFKTRKETALAILTLWPSLASLPDAARIDPSGTRRRVQALATRGWTQRFVAERVGCAPSNFRRNLCQARVTARFARAVRDVYDELCMRTPTREEVPQGMAERTVREARSKGWEGPLAWDDDTIDNPSTLPMTDAVEPIVTEGENVADRWLHGESVILGSEDRKQVLQHLMEWTTDRPEEVAARLEISLDTLWQTWSRLKKQARQEGRTEPWRRVYVPRERDLKQNQLEEAA